MKKILQALLLISVLVLASTANANIVNKTDSSTYRQNNIPTIISIDNFSKVDDKYYRGAQPNINDIEALNKLGIKTVINLRNEDSNSLSKERLAVLNSGLNYINIPMLPYKAPTQSQINKFFKIINNPKNQPVFVHCMQGNDRTGVMTALYRVNNYKWSFDKAYSEMKKLGYHWYLYPRQKSFLSTYTKSSSDNKN